MEGKATFTLTNAETGKIVKQVTEHNLVTDAVQRILNPPANKTLYSFSRSSFFSGALPVYKILFSGIMLLGNTLEESKNNVMLNKDCIPIATAGDAYSGTSTTRGSLNANETYATENGYHFTWDFATDKANGTIKCAALTSKHFGNTGFNYTDQAGNLIINPAAIETQGYTVNVRCGAAPGYCVGSFKENTLIYVRPSSNTTNTVSELIFTEYQGVDLGSIGILDETKGVADNTSYMTETASHTVTTSYAVSPKYYFYNSEDDLMYFGGMQYFSDTRSYSCNCVGIDMTDFTVKTEISIPVPNKYATLYCFAYYGGKLYLPSSNSTIGRFAQDGTLEKEWSNFKFGSSYLSELNGMLVHSQRISTPYRRSILLNDEFYPIYDPSNSHYSVIPSADVKLPYVELVYPAGGSNTSSAANPYLGIASCYLATINNLSEPLTKTSDHTLKITYDLVN